MTTLKIATRKPPTAKQKNNFTAIDEAVIRTPIGPVGVKTADQAVLSIRFLTSSASYKKATHSFTKEVVDQLESYFDDASFRFNLPFHLSGTEFQTKVWKELNEIPLGRTYSYGDLAKRLKTGPRAIGSACRTNPIPIIIPCHRVLSQQGLGGFNGATHGHWMKIKKWLIAHEFSL